MKHWIFLFVVLCLYNVRLSVLAEVVDPHEKNPNLVKMPRGPQKVNGWLHYRKIGQLEFVREGMKKNYCLKLSGGRAFQYVDYKDTPWGRGRLPDGITNRFFRVSALVRGKGEIRIGFDSLLANGKKVKRIVRWGEFQILDGNWQKLVFTGREQAPLTIKHIVNFELKEGGYAYIDDIQCHYFSKKGAKLSVFPQNIVAAPGNSVTLNIQVCPQSPISVFTYNSLFGGSLISKEKVTDGTFTVHVPENVPQSYRIHVAAPELGLNKVVYVQVVTPGYQKVMTELAGKTQLPDPCNILVFGDSLTDFSRGCNYVDILDYYLNKFGSGKVTIKNVGVGGDYITRAWDRMMRKGRGHRQFMYEGLFNPKPDIVILFFGANDTKLTAANDYKTPLVSSALQIETYKKIISYLRQQAGTGTEIMLLACPSFNFEICKRNTDKLRAMGRKGSLFGVDRYIVEFNKNLQKLSEKYHLGYVDLYKKTLTYPEKASLYLKRDGVHLTEAGNRLVAEEILRYIAEKESVR